LPVGTLKDILFIYPDHWHPATLGIHTIAVFRKFLFVSQKYFSLEPLSRVTNAVLLFMTISASIESTIFMERCFWVDAHLMKWRISVDCPESHEPS